MVRIAQASKGETGYTDQIAGNQTGRELNITNWYSRPWDTVLRAKDPVIADRIAYAMEQAVANHYIGYDQAQRVTLFAEAQRVSFDLSKIVVPCECDCSSLVAVAVNAAGIEVPKSLWTGSMTSSLIQTMEFECLRDPRYLDSDKYLRRGDILLNTMHHAAVAIDNGSAAMEPYRAITIVQTYLQVREGPGSHYREFGVSDGAGGFTSWRIPPNAEVVIAEERAGWGRVSDTIGWVSLAWLRKI